MVPIADRTVTIRLEAKDGLTPVFARASSAADGLGRKIGTGTKATDALARSADGADRSLRRVGAGDALRGLGLGAAAAGLSLGLAVSKLSAFEAGMSKVKAYLNPTTAEFEALRGAALEMGTTTAFSASEAAGAITELGKAGVSTKDILSGGLKGALDLAAAGELDVAEAAETAASAMTQFGLSGTAVPHIADLLAAGAGKAQGSVHDMGMALKQTGLVAAQFGLSIEESTGGLAAFASAGLTGSDAGTSMKTMLQRLVPQSEEAAKKMAELGISAFDANGNFIGLANYAGVLNRQLGNLDDQTRAAAMGVMFGSDAVRAANVLYEQGAGGIQTWIEKVNDTGYAAKTAAELNNNLNGDLKKLGNTFETVLIAKGGGVSGMLRMMAQTATGLVGAINDLPGPVLAATAALVGMAVLGPRLAALGATISGNLTGAVQKYRDTVAQAQAATTTSFGASQKAMVGLRTAGSGLMSMLGGPWGIALMGATAAVGLFATQKAQAAEQVKAFTAALDADSGAMGENTRAAVAAQLEQEGWLSKMQDAGVNLADATDAIMGNADAMARVEDAMRRKQAADMDGAAIDEQTALNQNALSGGYGEIRDRLLEAQEAHRRTAEATGQGTAALQANGEATASAVESTRRLTEAAEAEKAAMDALAEAVKALNGLLSAEEAVDAYTKSIQGLNAETAKNTDTLKGNSAGALANRDAMRNLVAAGGKVIDTMIKQGASQADVSRKSSEMAAQIDAAGRKAGFTSGEVRKYSDMLRNVPKSVKTEITANTGSAVRAIGSFKEMLAGIYDKTVTITAVRREYGSIAGVTGVGGVTRASGGIVYGPGTATSDSIPAWLSNGEYVVNARATARNLALLEAINSGVRGFAAGGYATTAQAKPWAWPAASAPAPVSAGAVGAQVHIHGPFAADIDTALAAANRQVVHSLTMMNALGVSS